MIVKAFQIGVFKNLIFLFYFKLFIYIFLDNFNMLILKIILFIFFQMKNILKKIITIISITT